MLIESREKEFVGACKGSSWRPFPPPLLRSFPLALDHQSPLCSSKICVIEDDQSPSLSLHPTSPSSLTSNGNGEPIPSSPPLPALVAPPSLLFSSVQGRASFLTFAHPIDSSPLHSLPTTRKWRHIPQIFHIASLAMSSMVAERSLGLATPSLHIVPNFSRSNRSTRAKFGQCFGWNATVPKLTTKMRNERRSSTWRRNVVLARRQRAERNESCKHRRASDSLHRVGSANEWRNVSSSSRRKREEKRRG